MASILNPKWPPIYKNPPIGTKVFSIQDGRHCKPTMNINSQHHNLLGNQISSKSEDFYIVAAILDSRWPP
jgi:hypothetical protein